MFKKRLIEMKDALDHLEFNLGRVFYVLPDNSADRYEEFVQNHRAYLDGVEKVYTDFQSALDVCKAWDKIILAAGGYDGNFTTPLNATAPWVEVVGTNGTYMTATSSSSPIIEVRARGWKFKNIEFDNPTGAAGLRMTKEAGLATRGADFFKVEGCLFYGGKTGIEFNGGGTYWKIYDNHFSLINTAGGGGIYVGSSSYQIPALGDIKDNRFDNNVNHIYGGATRGFSDTRIRGNDFQADGVATNATILLDIRGSGAGGNSVIDNYFDLAKADFDAAATLVRANATDYGAGNHFKDGDQTDPLGA